MGRLNVAGTRFCTATLISETVIVTAAHCLFHPRTRAEVPLGEFRFVAGLRMGKSAAVRGVVRAVTQPDFTFEGFASPAGVVADLALLELDERGRGGGRGGLPDRRPRGGCGPPRHRLLRPRPGAGALDREPVRARRQLRRRGGARLRGDLRRLGGAGPPGRGGGPPLVAVVSAMGTALASKEPVTIAVLAGPWIEPLLAALAAEPREE